MRRNHPQSFDVEIAPLITLGVKGKISPKPRRYRLVLGG